MVKKLTDLLGRKEQCEQVIVQLVIRMVSSFVYPSLGYIPLGFVQTYKRGDFTSASGFWYLPYILAHYGAGFLESLSRTTQGISTFYTGSDSRSLLHSQPSLSLDKSEQERLGKMLDELRKRVNDLELSNFKETERLTNVTRSFDILLEQDGYESTVKVLDTKLDGQDHDFAKTHDLAAIRLQLESLKEEWSQLKTCCASNLENSNDKSSVSAKNNIDAVVARDSDDTTSTKTVLMNIVQSLLPFGKTEDVGNIGKSIDDRILSTLTDSRVREIVREMLKVYDADKTGRVDYALESAGGLIISTRCTQRYDLKQMAIKILSFTLYYENNNPRTVIQGNPIQPGTCWAFQNFPGYLLIKLRSLIHVTGFTLEHAPKSILPNEEMKSAPRKFNVWGFTGEIDPEPALFGDYEFTDSDESLQYFPVQNTAITKPYEYIELRVYSNHGQLEYTCLYRFRVHGKPA